MVCWSSCPACSRIFNRFGNATKTTTTMYYLLYALPIITTWKWWTNFNQWFECQMHANWICIIKPKFKIRTSLNILTYCTGLIPTLVQLQATSASCVISCVSLIPDRAISGHLIHWRVSYDVHTTRMVTGALLLRGRGSGTLCRLNCKVVTLLDISSGVWRHFYSGRETTTLCDAL